MEIKVLRLSLYSNRHYLPQIFLTTQSYTSLGLPIADVLSYILEMVDLKFRLLKIPNSNMVILSSANSLFLENRCSWINSFGTTKNQPYTLLGNKVA